MIKKEYRSGNEKICFLMFCIFFVGLLMMAISPALLRIEFFAYFANEFLSTIKGSVSVYASMLGASLSVGTTIMFTVWQNERKKSSDKCVSFNNDLEKILNSLQDITIKMYELTNYVIDYKKQRTEELGDLIFNASLSLDTDFEKCLLKCGDIFYDNDVNSVIVDIKNKYGIVEKSIDDFIHKVKDVRIVWYDLNYDKEYEITKDIYSKISDFKVYSIEKLVEYKRYK